MVDSIALYKGVDELRKYLPSNEQTNLYTENIPKEAVFALVALSIGTLMIPMISIIMHYIETRKNKNNSI